MAMIIRAAQGAQDIPAGFPILLNRVWFESGSSRGVGEAARIPI